MKYVKQRNYTDFDLLSYRNNVYSQNGEDGIIKAILEKINIRSPGWCCEFGAWDGKHLSNTFRLISECGWNAVLIESDKQKFLELEKTKLEFSDQITAINSMVHYMDGHGDHLDEILSKTKIPNDFDILSIDVDGPDYHIWKSFNNYLPKIVIIEHSGIDGNIIQKEGSLHKKDIDGSTSFHPMKKLGEDKGYVLLIDSGNLIFVHKKYWK